MWFTLALALAAEPLTIVEGERTRTSSSMSFETSTPTRDSPAGVGRRGQKIVTSMGSSRSEFYLYVAEGRERLPARRTIELLGDRRTLAEFDEQLAIRRATTGLAAVAALGQLGLGTAWTVRNRQPLDPSQYPGLDTWRSADAARRTRLTVGIGLVGTGALTTWLGTSRWIDRRNRSQDLRTWYVEGDLRDLVDAYNDAL